jgi:hypothetical protein
MFPPTLSDLSADLDDFVPYLLHLGHADFCREQGLAAIRSTRQDLVTSGHWILSWRQDEYVGGLIELFRATDEPCFIDAARRAYDAVGVGLVRCDFPVWKGRDSSACTSAVASPRSMNLVEVVVDNRDLFPGWEKSLDWLMAWLETESFRRIGLVETNHFVNSPAANQIAVHNPVRRPRFTKRFVWELLQHVPFAGEVRLTKDNVSLVFALIAAFRATRSAVFRDAVLHWLSGFERWLFSDGTVSPGMVLSTGKRWPVRSTETFICIDLLADVYWHVDRNERWLRMARQVADFWLSCAWDSGLVPVEPEGISDWLDTQTDLVVALSKLAELTKVESYAFSAEKMLQAILHLHATKNGYVNAIFRDGSAADPRIQPKFNALLLKALIVVSAVRSGASLFGDGKLMELSRDR